MSIFSPKPRVLPQKIIKSLPRVGVTGVGSRPGVVTPQLALTLGKLEATDFVLFSVSGQLAALRTHAAEVMLLRRNKSQGIWSPAVPVWSASRAVGQLTKVPFQLVQTLGAESFEDVEYSLMARFVFNGVRANDNFDVASDFLMVAQKL